MHRFLRLVIKMAKQITIKDDEEIVEIEIPKTGKVEIAAEDNTRHERTMPDGKKYMSSCFYDEIFEGPCKVILIRKKRGVDVINKNGDLVK